MQIIWRGQSCFQITSQRGKNNLVNIVIDPFDETIGLRVPKLEADILLISHDHADHNNRKAVLGSPFIIYGPGEYEIKEVFIQGIDSYHDSSFPQAKRRGEEEALASSPGEERGLNTIYIIEAEEMKICHLGDLGQKELTDEQIEKIGDIDILMIPIGGVYTISAKEAMKIISQIEPKIVIPMHYYLPKLKVKLEDLDKFFKAIGIKKIEPLQKLSIKKKDILTEEAKIIVLKP